MKHFTSLFLYPLKPSEYLTQPISMRMSHIPSSQEAHVAHGYHIGENSSGDIIYFQLSWKELEF